jgi:nucleotidyltransferase/DNA polymerase involved in DNA repair
VRKPAVSIAETIRHAIQQALKLSVSEGIAANKLVSQIASQAEKLRRISICAIWKRSGISLTARQQMAAWYRP